MSSLAPFLPPHLLDLLARGEGQDRSSSVALLFSDISGFTSLTEALAGRGREGAEEIARVVNVAFRPAIKAIEARGGSIVSFGGDALFAVFHGETAVGDALVAAEAIRDRFSRRGKVATSAGDVKLSVSQAIHHGELSEFHLRAGDRRHYLVGGPAVRSLARLEAKTEAGEIKVSRSATVRLRHEPASGRRIAETGARASEEAIATYLDPGLVGSLQSFRGEFRRAAVLFLETRGFRKRSMRSWFVSLATELVRYDGILLKTDLSASGTKWICLFGIPAAHEGDPDRAARVALQIFHLALSGLSLRGGLHTGTLANILIGTRSRCSFDVMGDVVNTAARAMDEAAWGEVLVSDECSRELTGVTTGTSRSRKVKGKRRPLLLHALKSSRPAPKAIHVAAPMIGRDRELAAVVSLLQKARTGVGGTFVIKGDAGLGKSRLAHEASKAAREMGFAVHQGCAASFGGTAYEAISGLVRDSLGLPQVPGMEQVLTRVTTVSRELGLKAVDRHHLAEVLGARYKDSPIEHLDPETATINNRIAVREYLQSIARLRPRLFLLEDLHDADGASIEVIESLTKGMSTTCGLLLLLSRPAYEPPRGISEITLGDLPEAMVNRLIEAHLGFVPPRVGKLIRERAGGNPFYVEELVRHLLESGILRLSDSGYELARDIRSDDLPPGIETLIAARLDKLCGDARRVAQHASVIGRSFLLELLIQMRGMARTAPAAIPELAAREIVFQKVSSLKASPIEYVFKHALTRDVAYAGMLSAHRRRAHHDVADVIERAFAAQRESFLATLGHHRERAGERKKARRAYAAGARAAVNRYAHEEAERLYRNYLRLVERQTGESLKVTCKLGDVLGVRGRTQEATDLYREAVLDARRLCNRRMECVGLLNLGNTLWQTGRGNEARECLDGALQICREDADRDAEGHVLGSLASLSYTEGEMRKAQELYEQAIAIARTERGGRGEGVLLSNLALLQQDQGQIDKARTLHMRALRIARREADRMSEGRILSNLAALCLEQGRFEEGRDLMKQAAAINREAGNRRSEAIVIANLGGLNQNIGRMEDAREYHSRALAIARELDDRSFEGIVLNNLAGCDLVMMRDLGRAKEHARESEAILRNAGDKVALGITLARRGHIRLAEGKSARHIVTEVRVLAKQLALGPEAALAKTLAQLERAQAAFRAGRQLVCGHSAEDLSDGQRRFIAESRARGTPPL